MPYDATAAVSLPSVRRWRAAADADPHAPADRLERRDVRDETGAAGIDEDRAPEPVSDAFDGQYAAVDLAAPAVRMREDGDALRRRDPDLAGEDEADKTLGRVRNDLFETDAIGECKILVHCICTILLHRPP